MGSLRPIDYYVPGVTLFAMIESSGYTRIVILRESFLDTAR